MHHCAAVTKVATYDLTADFGMDDGRAVKRPSLFAVRNGLCLLLLLLAFIILVRHTRGCSAAAARQIRVCLQTWLDNKELMYRTRVPPYHSIILHKKKVSFFASRGKNLVSTFSWRFMTVQFRYGLWAQLFFFRNDSHVRILCMIWVLTFVVVCSTSCLA